MLLVSILTNLTLFGISVAAIVVLQSKKEKLMGIEKRRFEFLKIFNEYKPRITRFDKKDIELLCINPIEYVLNGSKSIDEYTLHDTLQSMEHYNNSSLYKVKNQLNKVHDDIADLKIENEKLRKLSDQISEKVVNKILQLV